MESSSTGSGSAIILLSGGQDSSIALAWARSRFAKLHAVAFDYGQRHNRELESAAAIAALAGVSLEVVRCAGVLQSTSPLTDPDAALETYESFASMERIIGERVELTFVPGRNLFFLLVAANRAVALGARHLVTGACEADAANYPDCTARFLEKAGDTINEMLGLRGLDQIKVEAPLLYRSKKQSVQWAAGGLAQYGAMEYLRLSHTCYAGEFPPCGKCHSCVLRAEGFRAAGMQDPLVQRAQAQSTGH